MPHLSIRYVRVNGSKVVLHIDCKGKRCCLSMVFDLSQRIVCADLFSESKRAWDKLCFTVRL